MGKRYDDICNAVVAVFQEADYPTDRPIPGHLWYRLLMAMTDSAQSTCRNITAHGEARGLWEQRRAGGTAGADRLVILKI